MMAIQPTSIPALLVEELERIQVPAPSTVLRALIAVRRGAPVPAARLGRVLSFERERHVSSGAPPRLAVALASDGTASRPQQLALGTWRLGRRFITADTSRGRAAYLGARLCAVALDHPGEARALEAEVVSCAKQIGVELGAAPGEVDWEALAGRFREAQPGPGPGSMSAQQYASERTLTEAGISSSASYFGSAEASAARVLGTLRLPLPGEQGEPFDELVRARAGNPEVAREALAFLQEWGVLRDELASPPSVADYAERWKTSEAETRRRLDLFSAVMPDASPEDVWDVLGDGLGKEGMPPFARLISRPVVATVALPGLGEYFLDSLYDQLPAELGSHLRRAEPGPGPETDDSSERVGRLLRLADLVCGEWCVRGLDALGPGAESQLAELQAVGPIFDPSAAAAAAERVGTIRRLVPGPPVREALLRAQRLLRVCAELDPVRAPQVVSPLLPGVRLAAGCLASVAEIGAVDVVQGARDALAVLSSGTSRSGLYVPRFQIASPELVDAVGLNQLSDRIASRGLLPELVRRLLAASDRVVKWEMPAAESIHASGVDGRVLASSGDAWIPAGLSLWELSTAKDVRAKARADFVKRRDEAEADQAGSTTFVIVTSRSWPAGQALAREWLAESRWGDVRMIDADMLTAWLSQNPTVHLWISEQLGLRPVHARALSNWWAQLVARSERPADDGSERERFRLPASLLLAGRGEEAEELRERASSTEAATAVRAGSREEAIAFVAAALGADDRNAIVAGEPAVVTDPEVFARLASQPGNGILIAAFDGADAPLPENGHPVIVPKGVGHPKHPGDIPLPRLSRPAAQESLEKAGMTNEEAHVASGIARRSFSALRRHLSVSPGMEAPLWAQEKGPLVAALALAGSWSESEEDVEVVAGIAEIPVAALERELAMLAREEDPPFVSSGDNWLLASPEDAWALVGDSVTKPALTRWRQAAARVIAAPDPSLELDSRERMRAQLEGRRRSFSELLRNGLSTSAALLGSYDKGPAASKPSKEAERLVGELLDVQGSQERLARWRLLADQLPQLAEAAPGAFLDALERDLAGPEPPLRVILDDRDWDPVVRGGGAHHTGLLWALELLAWSTEYLQRSALALARLAELDPPEPRLANRPAASLREIFLPWHPQTTATWRQRIDVIDALRDASLEVSWQLRTALLPAPGGSSASGTRVPRFRDWRRDYPYASQEERMELEDAIAASLLEDVDRVEGGLEQLLERPSCLPPARLDELLERLSSIEPEELGEERRRRLWETTLAQVAKHRSFPDAEWSLPAEYVARLEGLAERFLDPSSVARHAMLFDWRPELPEVEVEDRAAGERALEELRRSAVRDTFERAGSEGLAVVAEEARLPGFVGKAAAEVLGDRLRSSALPWLESESPATELARGWVAAMSDLNGQAWVEGAVPEIAALTPEAQAHFLLALEPSPDIWAIARELPPKVADLYWERLHPLRVPTSHIEAAAEEFLARERPAAAVGVLADVHQDASPRPELVEQALRAAVASQDDDSIRNAAFEVGELLGYLEDSGVELEALAQLEWQYYGLLHNRRAPRALSKVLAGNPDFFVQLVGLAYRSEAEDEEEDADRDPGLSQALASQAWSVLHEVARLPATDDEGAVDAEALRSWVRRARELLQQGGRTEVGDRALGTLLARSPQGTDGVWPAEAVRDLIEELDAREVALGMRIGRYNQRGVTTRSPFEGGAQEHELASKYAAEAAALEARWPQTAAILRELSESYRWDAQRHDEEAERRADFG